METIVRSPLPVRSMSVDNYYFAQNKETAKTIVAHPTNTYRTAIDSGNKIVFIFGSSSAPNEILWLGEEAFYEKYTLIGRVNRVIFE